MSCQHDDPALHADCSADCLIYDCTSESACCNSDCHPRDDDQRWFWEAMVLGVLGLMLREKILSGGGS